MKRKLLFAIVALMCSVGTWAETDYTSLMSSNWTGSNGDFGGGKERYQGANYEAGKIMYQTFTAPADGIYEIKFYAVTSSTSGRGFNNIFGDNIAQAYATAGSNKATVAMTVIDQTGCTLVADANIRTLSVEAAEGETIEYGLENIATGGNWYTIKELSAKMKTVAEIFQAQYDEAYAIWENSTENEVGARATFKTYVDALNTAMSGTLAEAQTASDNLAAALVTYESKSYPVKGSGVKYDFTSKMNMAINAWTCAQGNGPAQYGFTGATETYKGSVMNNGDVMHQTINGLANGEYEIHFYAVANSPRGESTSGANLATVYANDVTLPVDVYAQDGCTPSDYERTLTVMVTDGSITYGISCNGGGNWYVCKNVALYMTGAPDLSDYYDAIAAKISTANSIKTSHMYPSFATALQDAIDATDGYSDITVIGTLETMSENLTTAINNANASIADYVALNTAITNAQAYTTYKPVFPASETIYQAGITAAQTVYTNASAENCAATIAALTTAIQNSNVSDYNIYTNDYTYSYATLLNVDMTHWTTSDWAMLTGNQHWNGQTDQNYYEQTGAEWGQNSWSHSGTETVTLPAGNYVMGIIARASTPVTSTMTVTVGESTPITTTLTHKEDVGKGVTTAGVASFDEGTFANENNGRGWEYRFVAFTVANDNTPVTINVSASASQAYQWVSLTNPLLKGDVHPNQILLNQISSLVATLESYESQIHASTYESFSADLDAAAAATTETSTDDLTALVTALQADIDTASDMVTKMTTIATNKGDITSMINGDFTSNADGWSNGSYVNWLGRSWRGEGTNPFYERGETGTMSYTLSNMPAGSYKVVAASRTYDGGKMKAQVAGGEYGTELTGTGDATPANGTMEINTNGVEMPYSSLGGFTTVETGHNWHWITATGTLAADGDLVINFTATGNSWMAIDDVHLYCTNLDGTSYTRTVGDGQGTINTSNSVVTADIIMDNPNTILRSTGKVTTAAGDMNNNQYNSARITKLVLYDGYDFANSDDNYGLDNGATLYRNIPADTWCTLMVPFYPENLDAMKVTASLTDGVLTFEDAPDKDMNDSPMLVKSTAGVTAITGSRNSTVGINKGDNTYGAGAVMNGTYSAIAAVPTGDYVVARKNDADALYKVNNTVTLAPFRAYFSVSGSAGVKANILTLNFHGDADGITTVDNGQLTVEKAVIYNLAGQRMSKMQKGVNIVNGKKVMVK